MQKITLFVHNLLHIFPLTLTHSYTNLNMHTTHTQQNFTQHKHIIIEATISSISYILERNLYLIDADLDSFSENSLYLHILGTITTLVILMLSLNFFSKHALNQIFHVISTTVIFIKRFL